jgi:hypothetical protein
VEFPQVTFSCAATFFIIDLLTKSNNICTLIEKLIGETKIVQKRDRLVLDGLRAWHQFSRDLLGDVLGILSRMILSTDGALITNLGTVLRFDVAFK